MSRPNLKVINGSSRSPSRLDWATVDQAITLSGSDDETRTLKFQRLVLHQLLGILPSDADQYVTDGGDDCGVDCFVIDYNDNKIHLISTKTVEAYDKANKNFPGVEVSKLICFVRDLVTKAETLLIRCNPLLRTKVTEAWDAIDNGRVFHICVHICSNQCNLIERDFRSLRVGLEEFKATAFEHPLSRFSDDVSKNWSPPTSKSLRFVGREQFEHHQQIAMDGSAIKSLIGSPHIASSDPFGQETICVKS